MVRESHIVMGLIPIILNVGQSERQNLEDTKGELVRLLPTY